MRSSPLATLPIGFDDAGSAGPVDVAAGVLAEVGVLRGVGMSAACPGPACIPSAGVLALSHQLHVARVHASPVRAGGSARASDVVGVAEVIGHQARADRTHQRLVGPAEGVVQLPADADTAVSSSRRDVARPRPAILVAAAFSGLGQQLGRGLHLGWRQNPPSTACALVASAAEPAALGRSLGVAGCWHSHDDILHGPVRVMPLS